MAENLDLKKIIIKTLDSNKALDIVSIDLKDKSSIADYMIVASGTSSGIFSLFLNKFWKSLKLMD